MSDALWTSIGCTAIGVIFLVYGFTSKPLEFNVLNCIKRPLPVWAARLIYLPLGSLFVALGIRDLTRVLLR